MYKFQCAGCNACYIGETTRHITTRINEHFTDKRSHVYKHIHKNPACLEKSNKECFLILDQTNTDWQLQIKEGLYIGWETLN